MRQNKPEQHEARSGRLEGVHTDNAETAKCHQQLLKNTPALQVPRKPTRKPRAAKKGREFNSKEKHRAATTKTHRKLNQPDG